MSFLANYQKKIIPELKEKFGINVMAVPRVTKIVINVGAKEALTDKKILDSIAEQLEQISGQKPVVTIAKKSIAAFQLRQGSPVGVMVTLRGKRMYDFLEKLLAVTIPKTKDFRGIKRSAFDKRGNYSLGIKEHTIFPEIDQGKIDKIRSLQVVITVKAQKQEHSVALLELMGFPFVKEQIN